jgi:hypothetical protein
MRNRRWEAGSATAARDQLTVEAAESRGSIIRNYSEPNIAELRKG